MKKVLSVLLSAVMFLNCFAPLSVWADGVEETETPQTGTIDVHVVNVGDSAPAKDEPAEAPAAAPAESKPAEAPAAAPAEDKPAEAPAAASAQSEPAEAPAAASAQSSDTDSTASAEESGSGSVSSEGGDVKSEPAKAPAVESAPAAPAAAEDAPSAAEASSAQEPAAEAEAAGQEAPAGSDAEGDAEPETAGTDDNGEAAEPAADAAAAEDAQGEEKAPDAVDLVTKGDEESGSDSSKAPYEEAPEDLERTEDGKYIIQRDDQSSEIETTVGDMDQTDVKFDMLEDNYDVLVDGNGVYRLTYTISKDAEAENLTVDLTKALEALRRYSAATSSGTLQPGDTREFQIWIQSESGHTYRYKDGYFVLTTGTDTGEKADPDADPVIGFDDQELSDKYTNRERQTVGYHANSSDICSTIKQDADNGMTDINPEDYMKGPFDVLLYRAQLADAAKQRASDVQYYSTGGGAYGYQKRLSGILTNDQIYAIGMLNASPTSYAGLTTNRKAISNYLDEMGYGSGETGLQNYLIDYYSEKDGKDYQDFDQLVDESAAVSAILSSYMYDIGTMNISKSGKYDNFYKNIMRFVYGEDDVKEATGGKTSVTTTTKTLYDVVDCDDGQEYHNCVAANTLSDLDDEYWYFKRWLQNRGYPEDILVQINDDGSIGYFAFVNENGEILTASNSSENARTFTTTQAEYKNSEWSKSQNPDIADATIGNYMKGQDTWSRANAYFRELIGSGISASEASAMTDQYVDFMMAVNVDYELAGNSYQDSAWGWHNTIELERVDGEFHVEKVDENDNPVTSGETTFQLWTYKNNDESQKYYYTTYEKEVTDEQGNKTKQQTKGFVKYDPDNKNISWTIDTTGGKLDIDYAMLENMIYYLQEKVAPEGYELDSTVYIICDSEEDVKKAEELLKKDSSVDSSKTKYAGRINSEDKGGLTIKVVNVKNTPTPPPTPGTPGDNPPPPLVTIGDYEVPLAGYINMNEGDCFN